MKQTKYHAIKRYFIPAPSHWPLIGALGLFFSVIGFVNIIHGNIIGHYFFMGGRFCGARATCFGKVIKNIHHVGDEFW